jgi:hypothetical protein
MLLIAGKDVEKTLKVTESRGLPMIGDVSIEQLLCGKNQQLLGFMSVYL